MGSWDYLKKAARLHRQKLAMMKELKTCGLYMKRSTDPRLVSLLAIPWAELACY